MKKLFLILMALFIGFSVNAQDVMKKKTSLNKVESLEKKDLTHLKQENRSTNFTMNRTERTPNNVMGVRTTITDFPWSEGFEGATFPPTGWSMIDNDGDGNNWGLQLVLQDGETWQDVEGYDSDHSVVSASYRNDVGALTPDNWLITPALQLPADIDYNLTYWVGAVDANYYDDHYEVMISTTTGTDITNFTSVFEETLSTNLWQQRVISLAAYAGQTIYIAFVHNESEDIYIMKIDDISVTAAPTEPELEVLSVNPGTSLYTPLLHAQNLLPSAVVKNNAADLTTSATLNFAVTPGTYTQDVTIATLNTNASATFSVAEGNGLSLDEVGAYILTASTDFADENMDNNSLTDTFNVTQDFFAADNGTYVGGVGSNGGNIILGNLYEFKTEDIVDAFSIAFSSITSNTFTLRIYSIDEGDTTATQVYESETFNRNVIANPYTLTNFEITPQALEAGKYLFCIYQNTTTNIGCAYDGVAGGTLYIVNATTGAINAQAGFGNIAVRVHCMGDLSDVVDASVVSITAPASGINLTATETVTAVIQNRGGDAITGFDLILNVDGEVVTETYTGTIASLETVEHTFTATADLSAAGDHVIQVIIDLEDDEVAENDTAAITITNIICTVIDDFPWTEGFEDNGVACWTTEYVTGTRDWTVRTGNGGSSGITTAHSGDYNLSFYHPSFTVGTTKLITPQIDLSSLTNPVLKFWHGQAPWGSDQDELRVYYKTSASGDWTMIAEYTNSITAWTEETVVLPNASADYYIAFEGTGKYGYGVVVDDVSIATFSGVVDAKVVSINTPVTGINLGNETVTATIKNNGSDPITGFSLKLNVNGTDVATETYSGTIASLTEEEYTFIATADLSAEGEHTITVIVSLTGDTISSNDTASVTITNTICNIITDFPWEESFTEPLSACWQNIDADGDGNAWIAATLGEEPIVASESKQILLGIFEIPLTPDNYLITPQMTLDADYHLSFTIGSIAPNFAEKYSVLVSTTDADIESFTAIHTETFTSGGQRTVLLDLADYTGETIYIAFRHWDCTNQYVLTLDNVKVFEYSLVDAEVASVTAPTSGTNLGNETVKAIIKNNGTDAITGFSLILNVDGTDIATETYSGTIASAAQAEYTFTQTANLSAEGDHIVKVTVNLTDDEVPANNSAQVTVTNTIVGVESISWKDAFNIYPNPAENTVNITNLPNNSMVTICDLTGRTLKSFQATNSSITVDVDFAAGVYFVKIESEGITGVKKLIVK